MGILVFLFLVMVAAGVYAWFKDGSVAVEAEAAVVEKDVEAVVTATVTTVKTVVTEVKKEV